MGSFASFATAQPTCWKGAIISDHPSTIIKSGRRAYRGNILQNMVPNKRKNNVRNGSLKKLSLTNPQSYSINSCHTLILFMSSATISLF
jgi:hypothetical protein